jgi:hypothetical protein
MKLGFGNPFAAAAIRHSYMLPLAALLPAALAFPVLTVAAYELAWRSSARSCSPSRSSARCGASSSSLELKAVIQFIIVNGLADEVRRHDWAGLAKGYNGSSYAKNGYHTKLSAAFNKWQKIPDTKFTPDQVAAPKPALARTIIPPPKPALPVPAPAPQPAPAGFFMRLAALFRKVAS